MSDTHARTVAYVAPTQIPPSPPPPSEVGFVHWMRENLFSGVFNSLLTIISIAIIVMLVPPIVQWAFIDSVWVADSLSQCREIMDQRGEARGACWAVITERFSQFIYGFYPPELRWRPTLAFLLFFVAVAPVLFTGLPRMMLVFSVFYPVVAYFLIWGGSIWGVLAFIAAPVIGVLVFRLFARFFGELGAAVGIAAGIAAAIIWLLFLVEPVATALHSALPIGLRAVESRQLGGFLLALVIGIAGIVLSLPIGIALALGRKSNLIFIKTICIVFIEFIRGVPLITLLFVANSVLAYFFPPGSNLDLILRVVIMVTMFASAYMAEVIRGGLAALPQGQYEAADALGLNYAKSMRLIILPQALKISIPGIVNTFIGLFKDTTLVVVIGLLDPIGLINSIRADSAWNGIIWEFYVFVGLFFFIACFGMSRYSMYLERKLQTDHR